ncbi:hypothetical protein C8A03DRAFT_46779 [Achaetomium macrosporum]|uniref:Uncharacterized protein n=1 Tax=Achaetomium macrosporum TaxID=79813 RepID=A0AAN7C417_9PEZI|nr:hypothetical protein C8A03DRAFT_46779 [Achaetomium macrosporum]
MSKEREQTASPNKDGDELSFGIELEFLFIYKELGQYKYYWSPEFKEDKGTHGDGEKEAATATFPMRIIIIIALPVTALSSTYARTADWAEEEIKKAILSVPGAKIEHQPTPEGTPDHLRSMYVVTDHADLFSGWTIKQDGSVREDMKFPPGYGCLAFELTSPTLWDRPESHQHVFLVIQELANRFCLRVNQSTGFHCHVGAGEKLRDGETPDKNTPVPSVTSNNSWTSAGWGTGGTSRGEARVEVRRHSLGVLKRAAALMWAADGFLCHAHPPERASNTYCPPIRYTSRLAHGVELRYIRDGPIARQREHPLDDSTPFNTTTTPILPPQQNQYLPAQRPPLTIQALAGLQRRDMPNPNPNPHNNNNQTDTWAAANIKNKTVASGVRHIMSCKNRAEIASLFHPPSNTAFYERANYNFTHYRAREAGHHWAGEDKVTIEFREAAGTMNPLWVCAWASVCLGIFRFARDAEDEKFWGVIERLARAEEEERETGRVGGGRYDVVSLLFDLGLFAEGLYLERKLRVEDPVRFWYPCRLPGPDEVVGGGDGGARTPRPRSPAPAGDAIDPREAGWSGVEAWEREAASSGWGRDDGQQLTGSGESSPFVQSPTTSAKSTW